jgi:hypothetical protein
MIDKFGVPSIDAPKQPEQWKIYILRNDIKRNE